ncbi:MAG: hypothetical protein NZL93_03235, partial [Chthoniobacterales bacterium]|nr:hypothetical protein [Chthoniobacterales bacterium]
MKKARKFLERFSFFLLAFGIWVAVVGEGWGVEVSGLQVKGSGSENIEENPRPTWETQKQARTYHLRIPAPRGQITDRNGRALAQTRLSYNLALEFPPNAEWTDSRVLAYLREKVGVVSRALGRKISVQEESALRHFRNRSLLPFDIVEDLSPRELTVAMKGIAERLVLRQTYVRYYPHGKLAAHILGYVGRVAPLSLRPIENRDLIFPDVEGREGLEKIFDDQLVGIPG